MYNYIKKTEDYNLYISKGNEVNIENIPIQTFFNSLLKCELNNLKTREMISKRVFKFQSKIPIYINSKTLFMCLKSYRLENSFYINYFSIISYEYIGDYVIIHFSNNHSMKIHQKYSFQGQLKKCRMILDYLS